MYQIETEDKFNTVVESIRGSLPIKGFYKQITLTFNPWNERHWLKRVFFDEETRRRDTLALTTTYKCNEWLDDVDIKRYEDLYITNPRRARIVCDGEWGVSEGLIYENVVIKDFNKENLLKRGYKLCIGLDFGFTHDPTALCVCLIDNNEVYVVDEFYKVGLFTKDIAKMLEDKGYSNATIIADSAEPRLISELRNEYDIRRIKASRKGKDSVMAGISKLQGYKIYVHPDCKHIMDEFYSYSYMQDKEGNWLNKPEDKDNHLMDALRYSLQVIDNNSKIKTFKWGI